MPRKILGAFRETVERDRGRGIQSVKPLLGEAHSHGAEDLALVTVKHDIAIVIRIGRLDKLHRPVIELGSVRFAQGFQKRVVHRSLTRARWEKVPSMGPNVE